MAKESYFFSHDYGARNDPKLQKLLMRLGQAGKGVYWDLIEISFEQGGVLNFEDIESYAFALRTDCECINRIINEFELFKKNDKSFWSESVLKRLDRRNEISKKASESAQTRWGNANASNNNANALPSHQKTMLLKEKKGEERKENKNKVNNIYVCPELKDVVSFFLQKGYTEDLAKKAYSHYDAAKDEKNQWHDSQGSLVKNWKQKMISIWFIEKNKNYSNQPNNHDTKRSIQPASSGFGKI